MPPREGYCMSIPMAPLTVNVGLCDKSCGGNCYVKCPDKCTSTTGKKGICSKSPAVPNRKKEGHCEDTCGDCFIDLPPACPSPSQPCQGATTGRGGICSTSHEVDYKEPDGDCHPKACGSCFVPKQQGCTQTHCSIIIKGKEVHGTCGTSQPTNTIPAGPCTTGCGKCYISCFDPALCGASPNGKCRNGRCGCYPTQNGASCKNFLGTPPNPLPGNGGGCEESGCNAVAAKFGYHAACCPSGCS